jgi:hypothetical protein
MKTDDRLAGYVTVDLAATATSSAASLNSVHRWIDECTRNHSLCKSLRLRSNADRTWSPSRLLDLTVRDEFVVLCEDFSWSESVRYATLSYCWGHKPSFLTLTEESLRRMKDKGTHIDALPTTFKEAISFCRRAGIYFLWIDALCIIQDSKEDWSKEALLMSKVYRYPYVNLAATASENADGGLFRERNPLDVNLLRLKLQYDGKADDYYVARRPFPASPRVLDESPLNIRGWVTQERFIAPRTVHFACDQLHWECPELTACEIFPRGLKWKENFSRGNEWREFSATALLPSFRSGEAQPNADDILKIWSQLVVYYTHGSLTFPSDKLVAISGLAKIISEISRDDHYYAGIWSSHLLTGLMWKVTELTGSSGQYVAPSWSWASINGVTDYPNEWLGEPIAEVIDVFTAPKSDDPYGQLIGGCLRLKGLLCKFEVRGTSLYLKGSDTPFLWFSSDAMKQKNPSFLLKRFGVIVTRSTIFGMVLERSAEEHTTIKGQPYRQLRGILLKPTNLRRGEYRRYGTFGSHHTKPSGSDVRILSDGRTVLAVPAAKTGDLSGPLAVPETVLHKLSSSLITASHSHAIEQKFYENFDGVNAYTISII